MAIGIGRRQFISALGGATLAWPLAARAQQSGLPVIGYLHSSSPGPMARFVNAFKVGLKDGGYIDGQNVMIESRFAEGHPDRLPALATELVHRRVTLIATGGAELPPLAAKRLTDTIPIVFVMGVDPVKLGLVPSLARPAGNITGIYMFTSALENKRFGLLHEVVPSAKTIAAVVDPSREVFQTQIAELNEAAQQVGVRLVVVNPTTEVDLAPAFATAVRQGAGAIQVCSSPTFLALREQIVALAAQYRLPAIYEFRDYTIANGLMSYGTDLANAYRLEGGYVAKILKGEKPADLPVMQSDKVRARHQPQDRQDARPHHPASRCSSVADEVIE